MRGAQKKIKRFVASVVTVQGEDDNDDDDNVPPLDLEQLGQLKQMDSALQKTLKDALASDDMQRVLPRPKACPCTMLLNSSHHP